MKKDQIAPYRRHMKACPHRAKGKKFSLCECPVWGYGWLKGEPWRHSLQTADWARALRRIDILLNGGELAPGDRRGVPLVAKAADDYIADLRRRSLSAGTIRSNRKTLDHLCTYFGSRTLRSFDIPTLSAFCASRKVKPRTARKEIEHLRAFCAWCVERKWLDENPAKKIKPPRVTDVATLPFTRDEINRLLAACRQINFRGLVEPRYVRQRARAVLLTLLYSGLRVSDVAILRRSQLEDTGHLTVRTTKTGVPVKVLLHADAIAALITLPAPGGNPDYFFWSGIGNPESAAKELWKIVSRTGKLAGIHAHPHRFRDTFAVELLTAGADIRTVQMLLGHDSVKTTEKHYAHFVAAHQAILDSAAAALDFREKPARPLLVQPLKHRRRNAK